MGGKKWVDSKHYSRILPCSLKCCNFCEKRSKASSPFSYFPGVQRERDCNFENRHVPELKEVRLPVAEKVISPNSGLGSMFITNETAVGFTLKTTTTFLFEKLYIHMFSFLNNSLAIWCIRNYSQLSIFFFHCKEKFSITQNCPCAGNHRGCHIDFALVILSFLCPTWSHCVCVCVMLWAASFIRGHTHVGKLTKNLRSSPSFHVWAKWGKHLPFLSTSFSHQ